MSLYDENEKRRALRDRKYEQTIILEKRFGTKEYYLKKERIKKEDK